MPMIATPRKCAICEITMEKGAPFQFVTMKWRGRVDYLPAHVSCVVGHEKMERLEAVVNRALSDSYEI